MKVGKRGWGQCYSLPVHFIFCILYLFCHFTLLLSFVYCTLLLFLYSFVYEMHYINKLALPTWCDTVGAMAAVN